jgi:apolipoprotein N-acyltransferase
VRPIAALIAGPALYALALPPYDWSVLGWVALVPLFLVVRDRQAGWAFRYGMIYGAVCAWTVGWWIAQAGSRYFGMPFPLAVLAASLFAIVVWGTAFGLAAAGAAALLRSNSRWDRLAVPAVWVAAELLRGRLMGQTWALLGYTQHEHVGLLQIASVTGVYGISFLVAFLNAAIAEALVALKAGKSVRAAGVTLLIPAVVVAEVWGVGAIIAQRGPDGGFTARSVAVVQTNVPPAYEWTRIYAERQLMAHVHATEGVSGPVAPALIIWPENAITQYVETDPMLAARLADLAARHKADLLFGAPRYENGRIYNSVRLFTAAGRNGGHYDKLRLVPFAETGILARPSRDEPDDSPRNFTAGNAPGVLKSFLPVGVSICHEVLYPDLVSRSVREGAQLLVNVSNDGWLDGGYGTASRQHFAMAALRAVETRRYLVRAATTGVSGVVDPYGRVIQALGPGTVGVLNVTVAGRNTITPYVRFGDIFAVGCAALGATVLRARRRAPAWRAGTLAPAPTGASATS